MISVDGHDALHHCDKKLLFRSGERSERLTMGIARGAFDLPKQGRTGRRQLADSRTAIVIAHRPVDQFACFKALQRAGRRRPIQSNIRG